MVAHKHLHARLVYVRETQSTAVMSALGAVPIPGQLVSDDTIRMSQAAPRLWHTPLCMTVLTLLTKAPAARWY